MRNNARVGIRVYGLRPWRVKCHCDRTLTSVYGGKQKEIIKKGSISSPRESSVRENHKPWVQHNL